MKISVRHLLILAVVLAGCSPQAEQASGTQSDDNAGVQDVAVTDEAETPAEELWTADVAHVGPLGTDTHFDADEIAALLPEYEIRSGTRSREGEEFATLILTRPGAQNPAVEIVSGSDGGVIEEVVVYEAGRFADLRADIGDTFVSSGLTRADCWPGVEDRSGMVVCYAQNNPYLGYWFENADYTGPDGELPPADVLDAATIALLRWWNGEAG